MSQLDEFYTLKGYEIMESAKFTPAMEDYLEMICRILKKKSQIRIIDLSKSLNVRPSSASKMVQKLSKLELVCMERYSTLSLTEKGIAIGNYLLYRHNVIHCFLCFLNNSQNELSETEKIEHFLSRTTVENLDRFMQQVHINSSNF